MQVVNAGQHKFIQLELDADLITGLAKQAGFEITIDDGKRGLSLELRMPDRRAPLLLFDAADPANLGWFSRCQFYVDGQTGGVLQTPLTVGNLRDRAGHPVPDGLRIQLLKELPATFRLPGRSPVSEQTIYAILVSFLNALLQTGVGICGGPVVKPLAGRADAAGARN